MNAETLARFVLPKPEDDAFFAHRERATLLAAADVLLEGVDFAISDDEIVRNVERFVRSSRRGWRVRVLLHVVELAPLTAGMKRFSRLSRAERRCFLRAHGSSLCGRVRPLVYIGAYASLIAARSVGFVPVPERSRFVTLRGRR